MELKKFQNMLGQVGGTSMGVNVIPKIRKYDVWYDDLDDYDKIFGELSLDDDDDDDNKSGSGDLITVSSDEVKVVNEKHIHSKNEKLVDLNRNPEKIVLKNINTLSLKELQNELDKFVENENKMKEAKNIFPVSYSQIVSGRRSPSDVRVGVRRTPKKPKKVIPEGKLPMQSSEPAASTSVLTHLERSKRKRGGLNYSTGSSEFLSSSMEFSDDGLSDDTMYTVDETVDSRSGIDLNAENDDFASVSNISCQNCRSDASQMSCSLCQPYRPPLCYQQGFATGQTDWYSILMNEINSYVIYSRKFRAY